MFTGRFKFRMSFKIRQRYGLKILAFVLAATGRTETSSAPSFTETGLLLLRQEKKFVIWQNPQVFQFFSLCTKFRFAHEITQMFVRYSKDIH